MLCMEGFTLCKADSDVWMQCTGDTYEYVAVYVDDLLYAMKDSRSFLNHLIKYINLSSRVMNLSCFIEVVIFAVILMGHTIINQRNT